MGYLEEVDVWLNERLSHLFAADCEVCEAAKKEIKAKILESFRNGKGIDSKTNPKQKRHHQHGKPER